MALNPEYTPLTKNDTSVRRWNDLKKHPIRSTGHYHCALVVLSNNKSVGVYHHPASDADGEAAKIKIGDLTKRLGKVSTSCVIHRSGNSYSQTDLIHKVEKSLGIEPKHIIDKNLSDLFQEDTPVDIFITDEGIYAMKDGHAEILVSSIQLRQ